MKKTYKTPMTLLILFIISQIFLYSQQWKSNGARENTPIQKSLDAYKDFYLWQENENFFSNDSVLSLLGRWAWGPCLAVDADSNFAYIGNGPTFHLLDISDPSFPVIVGEYLTEGYVYDIELREDIAFVCIGGWLLILDVSDPSQPQKISDIRIATNDVAISFALVDSFAYVTTFGGVMWVVDISDLNNPLKRDGIAAGGQLAFCVEAKDRYVYVGNPEWPPMLIVDATNPDSLSRVDFEVGGWGHSAYIKDTLLFVGVHGYYETNYLKIYNVSNASDPQFLGEVGIGAPEDIMAITVSKNGLVAYMRAISGNIYSVDISDLAQPVIIDDFEKPIGAAVGNTGIAFSKSFVLSAHYSGLLTVDVSDADSLKLRSFFPTSADALELDSQGNLIFVACGLSGIWILDCSNPQKVENIANIITGGITTNVLVDDTLAYILNWKKDSVTDTTIGLWIIDINNPYQPKILTHYVGSTAFSPPHSITKLSNFIFITQTAKANHDTIMEIFDISDVLNPQSVGVLTGNYYPHNIAVKDSVLYLATSDRGLRIVDIGDIFNPQEVNVFQDSTFLVGVAVKNKLAFADRIDTLFVLDISDPINPIIIGKMGRNYGSFGTIHLEVSKDYLYWAEGALGIVDISDSTAPTELTRFISPAYNGYDVELSEELILFSDRPVGIWLLRNELITSIEEPVLNSPRGFQLLQNYPNPFNTTTTIEFCLSNKEKVLIEIFDLLGRRVETLLDAEVKSRTYKINFNATELSSGIYFYRLSAGEHFITKKMIVLR